MIMILCNSLQSFNPSVNHSKEQCIIGDVGFGCEPWVGSWGTGGGISDHHATE